MSNESLEMFDRMLEYAVKNPEASPDRLLVVSMKQETLDKIFTPRRVELVRTIKSRNPPSVGGLAKMVKRPVESVSRDLKILENYGLLGLVQKGKFKKPVVEKDALLVPLTA